MLRVTGVVTRVEAGKARIECSPGGQPACTACGAGRGCGWQRTDQPRQIEIDARGAGWPVVAGDALELEVDEGKLLQAAARWYLPPLGGVLLGPAVCRLAGLEHGLWPLLAGALGLAAGLAIAWRWTRNAVPLRWRVLGAAVGPVP